MERANRTLQDRLVKELRLAGICTMEDGNAFLQNFAEWFNAKFAKAPAKENNLHRPLNIEPNRLRDIFCLRDQRRVSSSLTLKYDHRNIKLEINDLTRGLVGQYVDVYEMRCGRVQIQTKGIVLPYTILNPERRVTHAAITENKRLGAVLQHIKEEQEKVAPAPKVKPTSARTGYQKTGKRPPGRPSKVELHYAKKRAELQDRAARQASDI